MDVALVVAIVAAVFAGLAAVFAGWSAWSSHRTAEVAAEEIKMARERHYLEFAPRITIWHQYHFGVAASEQEESVSIRNGGPFDFTSVVFTLTQMDHDRPIAGFVVGDKVVTEGDLGPLAVGQYRALPLRRRASDDGKGSGPLDVRLICSTDQETYPIPYQVEIFGTLGPFANTPPPTPIDLSRPMPSDHPSRAMPRVIPPTPDLEDRPRNLDDPGSS